jgi:xylulokinase
MTLKPKPVTSAAPLIVGIDVGTQSIRAIAFDLRGSDVVATHRPTPARMIDARSGEYDPDALFACVCDCLSTIGRQVRGRPVAGLAVASVGESCVLVDERGRALAPAPVWFDSRSETAAPALAAKLGKERIFEITGLPIDPTLTLCKLLWMKEHWSEALKRAGRVLCIADWIAFRLSGEAATDFTLASRTLCLDLKGRRWAEALVADAGIDPTLLSPLKPSGSLLGAVRREILDRTGLAGKPVVAVGGHDHLVGSYAAGFTRPGMVLDSLGTAEALLMMTERPLLDEEIVRRGYVQGAVETHRPLSYLGGTMNSSGGAVEWLRALIGAVPHETLIDEARAEGPGSGGVIFLPHLAYAPPPAPDIAARGAFIGLAASSGRGAVYRALLEGIALQAGRMVDGLAALPGLRSPREYRLIGGSSRNPLLVAIKAAVFGAPVVVIDQPEATALGAALLAGIAAELWPDLDAALAGVERHEHVVEPDPDWMVTYDEIRRRVFDPLQDALKPFNEAIANVTATTRETA